MRHYNRGINGDTRSLDKAPMEIHLRILDGWMTETGKWVLGFKGLGFAGQGLGGLGGRFRVRVEGFRVQGFWI